MDNPNTSYQLRVQSILPSINKKNEMKIYEFIEINRKEIIHMSVADAAEACGVSEAAIVRYAQKLGYKGYQAMKISIAQDVIEPGQQIYGQLSKGDTIPTIVDKIFDSNIQSLRDTSDVLSRENIDEAVNLILGCRRLLFFGVGGSGCVAMDGQHKFLKIGYMPWHLRTVICRPWLRLYLHPGTSWWLFPIPGHPRTFSWPWTLQNNPGQRQSLLPIMGSRPLWKRRMLFCIHLPMRLPLTAMHCHPE